MTSKKIENQTTNNENDESNNKMNTKVCSECGVDKPTNEYRPKYSFCKSCMNAKQRARNLENKKKKIKEGTKKCNKCGIEKDNTEFRINRGECGDCEKSYGRNYNKENYDKRREWVINNRERYEELQKKYYKNNKGLIDQKYRINYHTNDKFKLDKLVRRKTINIINKIKNNESLSPNEIIQYKQWFEFRFIDTDYKWENYPNKWIVDHVIPPEYFNLDDEIEISICYSWVNLQPLDKVLNRNKSNKINQDDIINHYKKLKEYIKKNSLSNDINFYKHKCNNILQLINDNNPITSIFNFKESNDGIELEFSDIEGIIKNEEEDNNNNQSIDYSDYFDYSDNINYNDKTFTKFPNMFINNKKDNNQIIDYSGYFDYSDNINYNDKITKFPNLFIKKN